MSVEMRVTLIGEDPEQQEAFDRPQPIDPSSSRPDKPETGIGATPPVQPTSTAAPAGDDPSGIGGSLEALTKHIEDLSRQMAVANKPQVQGVSAVPQPQPADDPDADRAGRHAVRQAMTEALDDLLKNPLPEDQTPDPLEDSIDALAKAVEELAKQEGKQDREIRHRSRQEMTDALDDMLKKPIDDRGEKRAEPEPQTEPEKKGFSQRVDAANQFVQRGLKATGLDRTRLGRGTGGMAHKATGAVKRVASLARAATGATAATTTAAGSSGAAAAASGAAATAGATTAAAAIGAVALPVAAVAAGLAVTAISVKTFSDAVNKAANELEDLSPAIAIVRAQHQISMEMARLDRAQRIGAGAAQMEAARDRIQESMYAVQTSILELLLKLSPFFETGLDIMNVGVRGLDAIIAQIQGTIATINNLWGDTSDDFEAGKRMSQTMIDLALAVQQLIGQGDVSIYQTDPFFDELLGNRGNPPNPQRPPVPPAPGLGGGRGQP